MSESTVASGSRQPGLARLQIPVRPVRFVLASLLAVGLGVAAAPAQAQFDNLPRLGDAGGAELPPETERRIGEAIMSDLRREEAILDDAELVDYLNAFAGQLTETRPAQGLSFEFFLLRDASLNAFALPGGYIGVHSGLMITAQTESELASVLAHEVGHVTQRHVARMLAKNQQSSVVSLAAVVVALIAATQNPQAAAGLVALGGSVQESTMLSFSRDAEREADRVGLEILREAGFQARDMVAFFSRMQQATRVYESGAPAYLRTHPLTGERMTDIQNRVLDFRYRQHADSLEFHLARAKLRAQSDTTVDGLARADKRLQTQLDEGSYLNETALWYEMALVATERRQFDVARKKLARAGAVIGPEGVAGHRFLARLQAHIEQVSGNTEEALRLTEAGINRFSDARALRRMKADLLIELKRYGPAVAFLEEEKAVYRADPHIWRTLAQAHFANNSPGLAHWATAEQYVLLGAWPAARSQLLLARQDTQLDFYRLSQIDSRLREIEGVITRERERE
ncbi:MAG: M48 family metalloprotease [Burkholderiaceae bacterium]